MADDLTSNDRSSTVPYCNRALSLTSYHTYLHNAAPGFALYRGGLAANLDGAAN